MENEKKRIGRPPTGNYEIPMMVEIIDKYIDETALPIVKEVCLFNNWNYDYVMQLQRIHEPLSQSIKKLLQKKEVALEKGALDGTYQQTMAIFSLKQPAHGWTDKLPEDKNTEPIRIVLERPAKKKKEEEPHGN
jgi:hypothetical protein